MTMYRMVDAFGNPVSTVVGRAEPLTREPNLLLKQEIVGLRSQIAHLEAVIRELQDKIDHLSITRH